MSEKPENMYPIMLNLKGVPVLVVGGGAVAARKTRGLLACGATVTVVAREFAGAMARLKGARRVKRAFRPRDLDGKRLVFAATNDPELNTTIASLASKKGCWVNVAAPPEAGDMIAPSCVRRGSLCVAVSTGGVSAAAAKSLREVLGKQLDAAWGAYLRLLRTRRERIRKSILDPRDRRRLLKALGHVRWVSLVREKGARLAGREMDALIRQEARR